MRAVYDLKGDDFRASVPQVGDVMATVSPRKTRLTVPCVYRSRWAVRLVYTNGMTTMEKEVDMVKKHLFRCMSLTFLGMVRWTPRSPSWVKLPTFTLASPALRLTRSKGWTSSQTSPSREWSWQVAREHRSHLVESDSQRRPWPEPRQPEQRRDRSRMTLPTLVGLSNRVTNNVLKRLDLASTNKTVLKSSEADQDRKAKSSYQFRAP